jgi:hypothetical protein
MLLLTLLLTTFSVPGTPIKEGQARKAVETWVRDVTAQGRADAVVSRCEPYQEGGTNIAYIVQLVGGGYCIAGADSRALPVYWYSPKGSCDPNKPGFRAILKDIAGRLRRLTGATKAEVGSNAERQELARRARAWDDLSAGRVSSSMTAVTQTAAFQAAGVQAASEPLMMELPLTSQWNQSEPYNRICPALGQNRTVVGCVATAMAQVMNYWRWPTAGSGTASGTYHFRSTAVTLETSLAVDPNIPPNWGNGRLRWSSGTLFMSGIWDESQYQAALTIRTNDGAFNTALDRLWNLLDRNQTPLSADFGATTYRWDLLRDKHTNSVTGSPGDDEVAKLSFHVGMAVGMDYGVEGSGAQMGGIPNALANHFDYYPSAFFWALLNLYQTVEEIQWHRPVLFGGYTSLLSDLGHCWVVFGYNMQTDPWQFKMNLGWGGQDDGWYSFDTIPDHLNHWDGQVTLVAPRDVVRFVGFSGAGDGSPLLPYHDIQDAISRANDGTTLIFKAGSVNTFSGPSLVIDRPLTLKGYHATLTRQEADPTSEHDVTGESPK